MSPSEAGRRAQGTRLASSTIPCTSPFPLPVTATPVEDLERRAARIIEASESARAKDAHKAQVNAQSVRRTRTLEWERAFLLRGPAGAAGAGDAGASCVRRLFPPS